MTTCVCAATWPFGKPAADEAARLLAQGADALDALEAGLNVVELDPASGPYFVGLGGIPNAAGSVQLDAAVMRGSDCAFGAVGALEWCPRAVSVARKVLENSPHSLLVGAGANQFAAAQGFAQEPTATADSDAAFAAHQAAAQEGGGGAAAAAAAAERPLKTDTLSAVALDRSGAVSAAVTTSGMSFKAVGRVGDSPIAGAGLYADAEAGAAVATGDGDHIMRFCPALRVVDAMGRGGLSPDEACASVIAAIFARVRRSGRPMFEMALLAISPAGEVGAGSTFGQWRDHVTGKQWAGFPYAVATTTTTTTGDAGGSGGAGGAGVKSEMRICAGIDKAALEAHGMTRQPWSEEGAQGGGGSSSSSSSSSSGGIFPTTAGGQQ